MNTTATHDTKKGEDVRARLNVLSEISEEWRNNLRLWHRFNRKKRLKIDGTRLPDKNDEYFLYQTIIGSFPFFLNEYDTYINRIKEYVTKAVREAKVHTNWLKPDITYEDAFITFVEKILDPSEKNVFFKEFLPFHRKIAFYGVFNSLSQVLLKMTIPGLPDFYQGTELWDFNLVDPDNRRPVDYAKRRKYLLQIKIQEKVDQLKLVDELLANKEDGRIKLFLIYKVLHFRRTNREIFEKGTYIPLEVEGKYKAHITAFARNYKNQWMLTIVPRFLTSVINENELPIGENVWEDTSVYMPEGINNWQNIITNQQIDTREKLLIGEILQIFPVALLLSD